jgi:WD40 repeat protein
LLLLLPFLSFVQTNLLATCGADATVQLFDLTAQRQLPALAGHSKRVTAAVWGEDSLLVSASNDKTVRFWRHSAADDAGERGGCLTTARLSKV